MARNKLFTLLLTTQEFEKLKEKSLKLNCSMSEYLRMCMFAPERVKWTEFMNNIKKMLIENGIIDE